MQATNEADVKINQILAKIKMHLYVAESDEGLLEIDFADYEDCFFVDMPGVKKLLDIELARLEGDFKSNCKITGKSKKN